MLGELTSEQIDQVLRAETLGRIGCVADDWPYVVPVTYAYDGEHVYVHSAEGMKLRAMRARPAVCFEVEQVRGPRDWRTVIARGYFEPLWRDVDEYAMKLLASRFASTRPSDSTHIDHVQTRSGAPVSRPFLYRIRLLERSGRFESG
jgi:nitroimidazol reductase NimA-like FMN-containing flavoprotein (pyridoxamine 5'-phosphate oxidase superfamily)